MQIFVCHKCFHPNCLKTNLNLSLQGSAIFALSLPAGFTNESCFHCRLNVFIRFLEIFCLNFVVTKDLRTVLKHSSVEDNPGLALMTKGRI